MDEEHLTSTLRDLVEILKKKAPILRPSIFPSQFSPRSVMDLCACDEQVYTARSFLRDHGIDESVALLTDVDVINKKVLVTGVSQSNPLDIQLCSLEYLMRVFVMGTKNELSVLNSRFLEANGYTNREEFSNVHYLCLLPYFVAKIACLRGIHVETILPLLSLLISPITFVWSSQVLQEVCDIAYSLKIILRYELLCIRLSTLHRHHHLHLSWSVSSLSSSPKSVRMKTRSFDKSYTCSTYDYTPNIIALIIQSSHHIG